MTGKTIFITYRFDMGSNDQSNYGYSTPIHCNYITKLETEELSKNKQINIYFDDYNDFPYLRSNNNLDGQGWTATGLTAIVQIVDGIGNVQPKSNMWKCLDITDQILDHVIGESIDVAHLVDNIFVIDQNEYNVAPYYDLSYLNYPLNVESDRLAFGEEAFFFGDIKTDIKATAYTTDIPIELGLNEFNTTTNPTWDKNVPIQISEIGIYDDDGNLVAIGKLNNPISKDNTIHRTIVFAIDF